MPRSGLSADAGHYLVLGFDKSIVLSAVRPRFPRAMTQMLRRLAFFLLGRDHAGDRMVGREHEEQAHAAAEAVERELQRGGQMGSECYG